MKATDFDLSKELKFDVEHGLASFQSSRMIILDANAMGLLRQKILDAVGWEKAREMLLKFGYQNGFSDFMQMKLSHEFDTETDLIASGPVIHTWEGIVHAVADSLHFDRARGDFFFSGRWDNSYEAEQHLCFNPVAREPVCWTLMGYASGWCTAFFEKPIVAIETKCVGKGDSNCENRIQPVANWGAEASPYIAAFKEFVV